MKNPLDKGFFCVYGDNIVDGKWKIWYPQACVSKGFLPSLTSFEQTKILKRMKFFPSKLLDAEKELYGCLALFSFGLMSLLPA